MMRTAMTSPVVCTIVSNNYLAFARVWANSLLDRHPDVEVYVLIVDDPAAAVDYAAEAFEVVFARDLGIPAFPHFAFKYSLLELNTAVKPYFLEYLHRERGATSVLYFDPDIQILGSLQPLFEALTAKNLLLTPHLLAPLEDDKRPTERNILMSGVYNLGFLGLSCNDQTLDFLDWWQRRLYTFCLHRIEDGLFVDQRWMDLAPCLVDDVEIVRDPGYNVAYWNLSHRRLEHTDSGWKVNGVPLRFFHFSGLVVDDLNLVSKYQDRIRLRERPDLGPLFTAYQREILAAGWEQTRTIPYAYGHFEDGPGVPDLARIELQRLDPVGDRWPNPFAAGETDSFHSWLVTPVNADEGPARLPRMALILWQHRSDLQGAFPAPLGADHPHFVRWLLSGEPRAAGVDDSFFLELEPLDTAVEPPAATEPPAADDLDLLACDPQFDDEARPKLPRISLLIWEKRPDLQEAFPAPMGPDRAAFARWLVTFARVEYGLPTALWEPTFASLPIPERVRARSWWWLHRLSGQSIDNRGSWRDFGPPA